MYLPRMRWRPCAYQVPHSWYAHKKPLLSACPVEFLPFNWGVNLCDLWAKNSFLYWVAGMARVRRLVQISNKHVGRYNWFVVPGSSFLVTSCSQAGAWERLVQWHQPLLKKCGWSHKKAMFPGSSLGTRKKILACMFMGQAPRYLFIIEISAYLKK